MRRGRLRRGRSLCIGRSGLQRGSRSNWTHGRYHRRGPPCSVHSPCAPTSRKNRGSNANNDTRCPKGKRIASTSAEAGGSNPVARGMVRKQQMRCSERKANLLLQVHVALANGDLAKSLAHPTNANHLYAIRAANALSGCRISPSC